MDKTGSCSIKRRRRKNKGGEPAIKDIFFRRFFVPLIVSILILFGIVTVISTPPGTGVKWDTFSTAFGDTAKAVAKVGGRRH
jgi:hypothetical protein